MTQTVCTLPEARFLDQPLDHVACPSCFARPVRAFYALHGIPVHSCLLVDSRERALAFPTGDLQLALCPSCGFIFNALFDPSRHNYSTQYEETQGFSDCFNAFQVKLVTRLIEQYGIRDKAVLEIGCGKGEFLNCLCQLGHNRGIGIDPGYVPGRQGPIGQDRALFIQDFYSERYAHLPADVIVCRHTLEHLAPVGEFLRTLRRSIGARRDTLVFFELPDVRRVLTEGAFWDIYYEHCSYFSCGALARLFRREGFDLLELSLDYDGQYIMLVAKPAGGATQARLELEDDLGEMALAVDRFDDVCGNRLGTWRNYFASAGGRTPVVWGSGSKGVSFLTTLGLSSQVPCVVDINPYRQGRFMPGTGQPIVAPNDLRGRAVDDVIVMNPVYCREIAQDLAKLDLACRLLPVTAEELP